jgi:hypothetical protein
VGTRISLLINLKPSATACNNPQKPTRLGPKRRWIAARNLRSDTTKNAIQTSKGTILFKTINIKHKNHLIRSSQD